MIKNKIPIYFITSFDNHYHLPLGMIIAYAKQWNQGQLLKRFNFMPLQAKPSEVFKTANIFGAGIWLFSIYMWNSKEMLLHSKRVKEINSLNVTIHGGPEVPNYQEAIQKYMILEKHVDIAVHGEGEYVVAELLNHLGEKYGDDWKEGLEKINSLSFCPDNAKRDVIIHTPKAPRIENLDTLPSPYTTGVYNHIVKKGFPRDVIIETNRGCPYSCTFCALGDLTMQKVKKFDLTQVKADISWAGCNKTETLMLADANVGIFKRDVDIAKHIAFTYKKYGYPKEVHICLAKNGHDRIVEIVNIFKKSGLYCSCTLGIQSLDPEVLQAASRSNIKNIKLIRLMNLFRKIGLSFSVDIMTGLPGRNIKNLKSDFQFFMENNILMCIFETYLLTNTPMANPNYIKKYKIKTINFGQIVSTSSYTEKEGFKMKMLVSTYELFEKYGYMRYIMRFLQWEHGILMSDFIHAFSMNKKKYPNNTKVIKRLMIDTNINSFYEMVTMACRDWFNIDTNNHSFRTVLKANMALMPQKKMKYPFCLDLEHDFTRYYTDALNNKNQPIKNLSEYKNGTINISDPYNISKRQSDKIFVEYTDDRYLWELESSLKLVMPPPIQKELGSING